MKQGLVFKGLYIFISTMFLSINTAWSQTCATSGTISASCSTTGNLVNIGDNNGNDNPTKQQYFQKVKKMFLERLLLKSTWFFFRCFEGNLKLFLDVRICVFVRNFKKRGDLDHGV